MCYGGDVVAMCYGGDVHGAVVSAARDRPGMQKRAYWIKRRGYITGTTYLLLITTGKHHVVVPLLHVVS